MRHRLESYNSSSKGSSPLNHSPRLADILSPVQAGGSNGQSPYTYGHHNQPPHIEPLKKIRFESGNHLSAIALLPMIIRNSDIYERKKTLATFAKDREAPLIELLDQKGKRRADFIHKNASLGEIKRGSQLKAPETFGQRGWKRGKILVNEFWAQGYYNTVIKKTRIKDDVEEIRKMNRLSHDRKEEELRAFFEEKLGTLTNGNAVIEDLTEENRGSSRNDNELDFNMNRVNTEGPEKEKKSTVATNAIRRKSSSVFYHPMPTGLISPIHMHQASGIWKTGLTEEYKDTIQLYSKGKPNHGHSNDFILETPLLRKHVGTRTLQQKFYLPKISKTESSMDATLEFEDTTSPTIWTSDHDRTGKSHYTKRTHKRDVDNIRVGFGSIIKVCEEARNENHRLMQKVDQSADALAVELDIERFRHEAFKKREHDHYVEKVKQSMQDRFKKSSTKFA
eukprot:TRINITY_DN9757_c0_g1_i4.p1 TRINITY_DN9757_c0_g1~~TRINITY_DN9757_c0_g1_i4.p1  ORF type:complete len:451 (-),score=33.34 TRINITY_DN9757_c0_g1_i4:6-1358(-)